MAVTANCLLCYPWGEVVLSESTLRKAGLEKIDLEKRTLVLKGKSEPMDVWAMRLTQN